MTVSEFEALRSELSEFRAEMRQELAVIRTELANKPGTAALYQVSFGSVFALAAFAGAVLA